MRTILLYSMAAQLSFSGICFAIAEGSPLAGFSLILALATLFFVDLEEKVAAPVWLANVLGLVAFAAAGLEFFNGQIESRLLSGGHLIVYLTWVFMIQRKENRHFWWLSALSILQMATASVLTTHVWFGGALVAFSFVATWTMTLFLLYRSTQAENGSSLAAGEPETRFVVGDSWAGGASAADHRLLNWRVVSVSVGVTCLGLCLSFLFFLFTPRIWIGQFSFLSDEAFIGRPLTGFTDEVRLGDIGEIMENDEVVLELELLHGTTNQPFTESETERYLGAEPLFRGTVMEIYENGRWRQLREGRYDRMRLRGENARVIQNYLLHPIGSQALFSHGDVVAAGTDIRNQSILKEQYSDELKRDRESTRIQKFEYQVYSNGDSFDTSYARMRAFWPHFFRIEFLNQYQRFLRMIPNDIDRVRELSAELVAGANSLQERGDRLLHYLKFSDDFSYSLDLKIDDASIDPIEDFLFNRKTGHCEYYASALAIMLRSVGIPSRLVSGFKGGRYDKKSGKYLIRQLHAHSWVEAYLDGVWVTYDPTPADRNEAVAEQEQRSSPFKNTWKAVQTYWTAGVTMSRSQQQELIYRPVQEAFRDAWTGTQNLMQGRTSGLKELFNFLKSPQNWLSIKGGSLAFVLLLMGSGLVWIGKQAILLLASWNTRTSVGKRPVQQVLFYQRFLQILEAQGIEQQPVQTAKEFVEASWIELKPLLEQEGIENWPADLANRFYAVRFGGEQLPETEAHELDLKLTELEKSLAASRKERS